MGGFCKEKIGSVADEDEIATWKFMEILFADQNVQKELFLKELGFEEAAAAAAAAAAETKQEQKQPEIKEEEKNKEKEKPSFNDIPEENFFDQNFQLPDKKQDPEIENEPDEKEKEKKKKKKKSSLRSHLR